jgi:hypothetical protein
MTPLERLEWLSYHLDRTLDAVANPAALLLVVGLVVMLVTAGQTVPGDVYTLSGLLILRYLNEKLLTFLERRLEARERARGAA